MFGALVRAALVLIAGSLLAYTLAMAGGELLDTHNDVERTGGGNSELDNNPDVDGPTSSWGQVVVDWWPAIVVATVVAILIGSAIERRRRVRV